MRTLGYICGSVLFISMYGCISGVAHAEWPWPDKEEKTVAWPFNLKDCGCAAGEKCICGPDCKCETGVGCKGSRAGATAMNDAVYDIGMSNFTPNLGQKICTVNGVRVPCDQPAQTQVVAMAPLTYSAAPPVVASPPMAQTAGYVSFTAAPVSAGAACDSCQNAAMSYQMTDSAPAVYGTAAASGGRSGPLRRIFGRLFKGRGARAGAGCGG